MNARDTRAAGLFRHDDITAGFIEPGTNIRSAVRVQNKEFCTVE